MKKFRFLASVESLQNNQLPEMSRVYEKFGGNTKHDYVIRLICDWSICYSSWVSLSLNAELYDPPGKWSQIFPEEGEPSLDVQLKEAVSKGYIILDSNWVTPTLQLCEYLESV
jgi:hypothetical protein